MVRRISMTPEQQRLTVLNEGYEPLPYQDSRGIWTVGVGHNMNRPLPKMVVDLLLEMDYEEHRLEALKAFPFIATFDEVRFAAVVDLVFNMGVPTFSKFRNTLKALEQRNWRRAAQGLRASKWFKQVGRRGPRIVRMIEEGKWPWQM